MIFTYNGSGWDGKLIGDECIVRGNARVVAEIHLDKEGLRSQDKGLDPDGNLVFGGIGMYHFKRGRLTQR